MAAGVSVVVRFGGGREIRIRFRYGVGGMELLVVLLLLMAGLNGRSCT